MTSLLAAAAASLAISAPVGSGFDHGDFDRMLRAHVVDGMVDYDGFAADSGLARYLGRLAATDPTGLPRDEQLAFWLNAYNAYTVQLIVSHRERRSIRNINRTLGLIKGRGPWSEKLVVVGGKTYDLETVEQQLIRPVFREPRVHFALVCAAMGCPPLRSEAYTGADLDRQLDDQARLFLTRSPEKNRVDLASETVWVSEIFKFNDYAEDFGGSPAAIMRFIARYYPAGPARDLLESGTARMAYTEYDWTLNSQEQARKSSRASGGAR